LLQKPISLEVAGMSRVQPGAELSATSVADGRRAFVPIPS
jgi:hypothetical protein